MTEPNFPIPNSTESHRTEPNPAEPNSNGTPLNRIESNLWFGSAGLGSVRCGSVEFGIGKFGSVTNSDEHLYIHFIIIYCFFLFFNHPFLSLFLSFSLTVSLMSMAASYGTAATAGSRLTR